MRLPEFDYLAPKTVDEALEHLSARAGECTVLAGGTDLLVRMKQGLKTPRGLLSLRHLGDLRGIRRENGRLVIGSCTPLAAIGASRDVGEHFPALRQAVRSVGAVSIQQHRGTIGGNICQDTRCLYYNQSAFFRSGRPPCHKAGGKNCYARKDSDRCHATSQSDAAPALIALGAEARVRNRGGERRIALQDLYSSVGDHPLTLADDDLLTAVVLPPPARGSSSAYRRLAYRSAIDYPIACAAAALDTDGGRVATARVVVGAVGRAPMLLPQVGELLAGAPLSESRRFEEAATRAMDLASAFAVDNVGATLDYRIRMIRVTVLRALEAAADGCAARPAA